MVGKIEIERFEQAVLPHFDAAYNLARWLTRNQHDAEDIVQESYLRALHSFHTFQVGRDGRAWLLTIVRNTCYTWLRKNRPRELAAHFEESAPDVPISSFDPEKLVLAKADSRLLQQALDRISVEYREALILRELEGFSYRQIAEIAGIPLGTVMSRLSRARKELQKQLREDTRGVSQ